MSDSILNMVNLTNEDGRYYFWAKNCNGLFSSDENGGDCKLEYQLEKYDYPDYRLLYGKSLNANDGIIVVPYHAKNVILFNTSHRTIDFIDLETYGNFSDACVYKEWIYLFGDEKISRVDFRNRKLEFLQGDDEIYSSPIYIKDNVAYINSVKEDEIFCYDLDENKLDRLNLPKRNAHYGTVTGYDQYIVLTGENPIITLYDLKNGAIETIDFSREGSLRDNTVDSFAFCRSDVVGRRIIFSPAKCNSVISLDMESKNVKQLLTIHDDERNASYIGVNNQKGYMIIEKKDLMYEVSRQYVMLNGEVDSEVNTFILPNNIYLNMRNICESSVNNLERFILNMDKL